VGDSGQGTYRGRASFECFSHRRSVTTTPSWVEGMLSVRYPPYSDAKLKKFRGMTEGKPDFDREGRSKGGLVWWFVGLGAKGKTGAGVRWAVVMAVAAVVLRVVQGM
jgi:beta-apo-4'-carotenal oxygenase